MNRLKLGPAHRTNFVIAMAVAFTQVSFLCGSAAHASGCNKEVKVPIHFARGAACWTYSGRGNTFAGRFSAAQFITIKAIVERYDDSVGVNLDDAQLSIAGPRDLFESNSESPNEQLKYFTPVAGKYQITIGPCAAWGSEVVIKVCAATKQGE